EFRVKLEADCVDDAVKVFSTTRGPAIMIAEYAPDALERLADMARAKRKFVVLAEKMNCDWLRRALNAGADAFLMRHMPSTALLPSLRLVLAGEKVLPTDVALMLLKGGLVGGYDQADPSLGRLSQRERDVLYSLMQGHPNKMIARSLNMAESTVK